MLKRRRGGIGKALGLQNAKLGMRVEGDPNDSGPPPGSPEFRKRAQARRDKLMGKTKHVYITPMSEEEKGGFRKT